ncbi:MAG: hypothetical protein JRH15_17055, partial [Deltaproteobacteria bacterium]|nr:hypothetical protein [Deltaproteobacteria bacterium]
MSKSETVSNPPSNRRRNVINLILVAIALVVGIISVVYIKRTAPVARVSPPESLPPLVNVLTARSSAMNSLVSVMGTVVPSKQLTLKARVAGEVIETHSEFMDGGIISNGSIILQIDPADYELAIIRQKSQLARAQSELKRELGHQDVARQEWELLSNDDQANPLDRELALRKPQLVDAKAALSAAEADLERARLDLDRTTVR